MAKAATLATVSIDGVQMEIRGKIRFKLGGLTREVFLSELSTAFFIENPIPSELGFDAIIFPGFDLDEFRNKTECTCVIEFNTGQAFQFIGTCQNDGESNLDNGTFSFTYMGGPAIKI